jgi:hypothetical protein
VGQLIINMICFSHTHSPVVCKALVQHGTSVSFCGHSAIVHHWHLYFFLLLGLGSFLLLIDFKSNHSHRSFAIFVCNSPCQFQERVTSTSYASTVPGEPDAKFSFIKVLNLSQCVAAAVVGFVFCLFTGHSFTLRPLGYFLTISATQTLGSPFSYIAMNYITYPMVTLVKSCKLVPVMVMGALIGGKRFSLLEYFCCLMITLGVVLFTCLKPNMGTETGSLLSVAIGCGLVVINLSFDGMTNALQDKVYKLHHISAGQMMCVMNVIGAVFLAAAMVSPVDPDVAFDMITGSLSR